LEILDSISSVVMLAIEFVKNAGGMGVGGIVAVLAVKFYNNADGMEILGGVDFEIAGV
jgi:hypothetical protein